MAQDSPTELSNILFYNTLKSNWFYLYNISKYLFKAPAIFITQPYIIYENTLVLKNMPQLKNKVLQYQKKKIWKSEER